MNNILLEEAIKYVERGFFVFPCREKYEGKYHNKKGELVETKIKEPRVSSGLLKATNDKNQIKSWWTRRGWENSCIGINAGMSKLFIIDIDIKNVNGLDNFYKLGISEENTWHGLSASGGIHIIFSDPNGIGRTKSNRKTGIDTRGVGGYFIAAPSYVVYDNGEVGRYKTVGSWDKLPRNITESEVELLGFKKISKEKKEYPRLEPSKEVERVKKALNKIPQEFCDNYSDWLYIGMALYSLGNDGLSLWTQWSQKSPRYKSGVCDTKWDTFKSVSRVGLGTIFYYAKLGDANGR